MVVAAQFVVVNLIFYVYLGSIFGCETYLISKTYLI